MGAREKKLQKLHISQNEILRMTILPCFLNSREIWNFYKNLFLGVISYNLLHL